MPKNKKKAAQGHGGRMLGNGRERGQHMITRDMHYVATVTTSTSVNQPFIATNGLATGTGIIPVSSATEWGSVTDAYQEFRVQSIHVEFIGQDVADSAIATPASSGAIVTYDDRTGDQTGAAVAAAGVATVVTQPRAKLWAVPNLYEPSYRVKHTTRAEDLEDQLWLPTNSGTPAATFALVTWVASANAAAQQITSLIHIIWRVQLKGTATSSLDSLMKQAPAPSTIVAHPGPAPGTFVPCPGLRCTICHPGGCTSGG